VLAVRGLFLDVKVVFAQEQAGASSHLGDDLLLSAG